jgi:hypothetical protein
MLDRTPQWIGQYILDKDGEPVPEPDSLKWAIWFEQASNRAVRQDHVGVVMVSTVFLGLDHYWPRNEAHEPVLWETMIFRGEHDQYQRRYTSRQAAEAGHVEAMMMIEPWVADIKELDRMMALQPEWSHSKRTQ